MVDIKITIFLIFILINSFAQKADSTDHLLGRLIVMNLEPLSDKINSNSAELNPVFVEKGNLLYFSRRFYDKNKFGPNDPEDIWCAKSGPDGNWEEAGNMIKLNSKEPDYIVHLAPPTPTLPYLLILGNRYNPEKPHLKTDLKYANSKDGVNWTKPENIKISSLEAGFSGRTDCFLTQDRSTLIVAMIHPGGLGENDLYICPATKKNSFGKPVLMGNIINSAGDDCSPFLTPDNKMIYFSSNGRKDTHGGHDIYVSMRTGAGWTDWSVPLNLGGQINGPYSDLDFTVSNDGTAYYAKGMSPANTDIYRVQIAYGDEMVLVKGRLVDDVSKKPVKGQVEVTREESGEWVAAIESDSKSGEFDILIPPGSKYLFSVKRGRLQFTPVSLNLEGYKPAESRLPDIYISPQKSTVDIVDASKPERPQADKKSSGRPTQSAVKEKTSDGKPTKNKKALSNKVKKSEKPAPGNKSIILDPIKERKALADDSKENIQPEKETNPAKEIPNAAPEAEQTKADEKPPANQTETSNLITFNPNKINYIYFNLNETAAGKNFLPLLDGVALFCVQNPGAKVKLDGYADTGKIENILLSKRRATAVKGYLLSKGIEDSRILLDHHGPHKAIKNATAEEMALKNRCVEIRIK